MDRLTSASLTGGSTARTTSTAYNRLGNVQSNTSTNTADAQLTGYQYTSGRPHAVNSVVINGVATTLAYNANGAITSYDAAGIDKDKFIAYNGYNQAVTIVSGAATDSTSANAREEFKYAPDGSRYYKKSSYLSNGQRYTEHTYYIGSYEITIFDAKSAVAQTEKSVFGDFLYIKRTPRTGSVTEIQEVLHRDYQGSVAAVTQGSTATQLAYESFGGRRNPSTLISNLAKTDLDALLAKADVMTFRGYTDHESLDRTGLIHMNGRIFDPQLARFLSPDPVVQAPSYSQSWNRYSYVFNNPFKYADPSGYEAQATEEVLVQGQRGGCGEVCQRTSWYYSQARAINSANARWETWGRAMYNVDSIYGQIYLSMAQGISFSLSTIRAGGGSKKDTNNILGALNYAVMGTLGETILGDGALGGWEPFAKALEKNGYINPDEVTIVGHGSKNQLEYRKAARTASEYAEILEGKIKAGDTIRIFSCNVGKEGGFAQELSRILKVTVIAPNNYINYNTGSKEVFTIGDYGDFGNWNGKFETYINGVKQ